MEPGHPDAAEWLSSSVAPAGDDRGLLAMVHEQARRHWAADPAAFEADWQRQTGQPLPTWVTVDAGLLASAQAWLATDTYTGERDYLASHPELLGSAADEAVGEALLRVAEEVAERYSALRQAARDEGAEAAYRPLLMSIVANQFTRSDLAGQRAMLAASSEDLLSATVRDILASRADSDEDDVPTHRALALLDLASLGEHEAVLDVVADPQRFRSLLDGLARRPGTAALAPAAQFALTLPSTAEHTADLVFYLAVAAEIAGDTERAQQLLSGALRLAPDRPGTWVDWLAEIAQHHAEVLLLVPRLTQPRA